MGDGKETEWWDAWTAELKGQGINGNGHGKSLAIEAQRCAPRNVDSCTEPEGDDIVPMPTPTAARDGNTPATHLARKPGRSRVTSLDIVATHVLPTPRAIDGIAGAADTSPAVRARLAASMGNLAETASLFPTPRAGDATLDAADTESNDRRVAAKNASLPEVLAHAKLFPTPNSTDGSRGGATNPDVRRAGGHQPSVDDVVSSLATSDDGSGTLPFAPAPVHVPTPRASDGSKGGPNQRGSSGDLMLPSAMAHLPTPRSTRGGSNTETTQLFGEAETTQLFGEALPTPTVNDTKNVAGGSQDQRHSPGLSTVSTYLPTPMVGSDSPAAHGQISGQYRRDMEPVLNLPTPRASERQQHNSADAGVALSAVQDWREYGPAIHRQEAAFGRLAPLPTEPNKLGRPRLSPRFSEWLMGLPDGWITDPEIWTIDHPTKGRHIPTTARNMQLKAAGNGVVPWQGAAALGLMFKRILIDEAAEMSHHDCSTTTEE